MEQADAWVERAEDRTAAIAQVSLWERTGLLFDGGVADAVAARRMARWLHAACSLLKAQNKRIILTDYLAQEVPWHVLGMQLTAAACLGNVGAMCGELLKWCDKNNVPLCEAMEGL
jgi:hypothetical protein